MMQLQLLKITHFIDKRSYIRMGLSIFNVAGPVDPFLDTYLTVLDLVQVIWIDSVRKMFV